MALVDRLFVTCEYARDSLLSEPLNVLSNGAFFVAAWLLWRHYRSTKTNYDEERLALVVLMALIGIGGALYHALPNGITIFADVAPQALFVTFILYVVLRRAVGIGMGRALALIMLLAVTCGLTRFVPYPYRLNDSIGYVPCLAALTLSGVWLNRRGHADAPRVLKACGVLFVALGFRVADIAVCPQMPTGTLFLWHIGAAASLYLLAVAIRERRAHSRAAGG